MPDIKIKAAVFNSANEMCRLLHDNLTMESSSIFKRRMDDVLTCCRNITGNKWQLLNNTWCIQDKVWPKTKGWTGAGQKQQGPFPGLTQLYQMQINSQQRIPRKTQPSAQDYCPGAHEQTGPITESMTHRSISNHEHQTQTMKGVGEFSIPAWQKTSNCDLKYSDVTMKVTMQWKRFAMHCSAYNSHRSTLLRQYGLQSWVTAPNLSADLKTSGWVPAQVGMDLLVNCGS